MCAVKTKGLPAEFRPTAQVIANCNGCPVGSSTIMELLSMKSGLLKRALCSSYFAPFADTFNALKFAALPAFSAETELAAPAINVRLVKYGKYE